MNPPPLSPRKAPAARAARALAALGLALGLPACGPDQTTLVVVALTNMPPVARQLYVGTSLDAKEGRSLETFPGGTMRFGLRLPAGAAGSLWIGVEADDGDDCTISHGEATVAVLRPSHIDTMIHLNPVMPRDCTSPQSRSLE